MRHHATPRHAARPRHARPGARLLPGHRAGPRRWLLALVASASGTAAIVAATSTVQASTVQQARLPLSTSVWVPCVAPIGEVVDLEGTLHAVVQATQLPAGGWMTTTSFNPQGVVGVGQSTGDTYRATGHTGSTEVSTPGGTRVTRTNNFRVVGPGPDNNLVVHVTWHATTLADGSVVGAVDNLSVDCV